MIVSLIADRLAMELAMPMTADPRWFQVAQHAVRRGLHRHRLPPVRAGDVRAGG